MSLQYQGSLTAGQAVPSLATAGATLTASLTPGIAALNAQIAGLTAASVAPPALLTDLVTGLTATLASLQTLIGLGVTVMPPAIAGIMAQLAQVNAQLSAFQLGIDFADGLPLTVPGVHVYTYDGQASDLGSGFTSALSSGLPGGAGGAEQIHGVHLLANSAGAIDALETIFS